MPLRKAMAEKDGVYLQHSSATADKLRINWLPLFKLCNAYDAVYNSHTCARSGRKIPVDISIFIKPFDKF
jgi:hypothetical protein